MAFDGQAPFAWREGSEEKLLISWEGKQVMILKGSAAAKALQQLRSGDEEQTQLLLAKLTGNFKRGNERQAAAVRSSKGRGKG